MGDYQAGPAPATDSSTGLVAVFLDAQGKPVNYPSGWYKSAMTPNQSSGQVTDIAEDFRISRPNEGIFAVVVPEGAVSVAFSVEDSFYKDNADPDGDFGVVFGRGIDELWRGGNDTIRGSNGPDTIDGGEGADDLYGGAGNDSLIGGKGSDDLIGNAGDDTLLGGEDGDYFYWATDFGRDSVVGGEFYTQTPWSTVSALPAGSSASTNTNDYDYLVFQDNQTGVSVDLSARTVTKIGSSPAVDLIRYSKVEEIRGSTKRDVVTGRPSEGNSIAFAGFGGSDVIVQQPYGAVGRWADGVRVSYWWVERGADGLGIKVDWQRDTALVSYGAGVGTNTGGNAYAAGTDTLQNVEYITTTSFDDVIDASKATYNHLGYISNAYEGISYLLVSARGGNDIVKGNGNVLLIPESNLGSQIFVDGRALTADGYVLLTTRDGLNRGTVKFTGVSYVFGTGGNDVVYAGNGVHDFRGQGGSDQFYGDALGNLASYRSLSAGVAVNLAQGIVRKDSTTSDLLRGVEAIEGTRFDDLYEATGFSSKSVNAGGVEAGFQGRLNTYHPMGGLDTVIGNGYTGLSIIQGMVGLSADLSEGFSGPYSPWGMETVLLKAGGSATPIIENGTKSTTYVLPSLASSTDAFSGSYTINGFGVGDRLILPRMAPTLGTTSVAGTLGSDVIGTVNSKTSIAGTETSNVTLSFSIGTGATAKTMTVTLAGLANAQADQLVVGWDLKQSQLITTPQTGLLFPSLDEVFQPTSRTISISGTASRTDESSQYDTTYVIETGASSSYTYSIAGFGAGDRIIGPDNAEPVVSKVAPTSGNNGTLNLAFPNGSFTTTVSLTGLSAQQLAAVNQYADLPLGGAYSPEARLTVGVTRFSGVGGVTGTDYADNFVSGNSPGSGFNGTTPVKIFSPRGGNDTVTGGAAFDVVSYASSPFAITVTPSSGAGNFTVQDGWLYQTASGPTSYTDTLIAINKISASHWDDFLRGGDGNDDFDGNKGADSIDGGTGWNTAAYGQSRTDDSKGVVVVLGGNYGTGAQQNPRYTAALKQNGGTPALPPGFTGWAIDNWGSIDYLVNIQEIEGSAWDDLLIGQPSTSSSGAGFYPNWIDGGQGADTIDGGGGNDDYNTVEYNNAPEGVIVDLERGVADYDGWGYKDVLFNIQAVRASRYDDVIFGDQRNNLLAGEAGNDTLNGGGGADEFYFNASYVYQDRSVSETDVVLDFNELDKLLMGGSRFTLKTQPGAQPRLLENEIAFESTANGAAVYLGRDGVAGADLTVLLPGVNASRLALSWVTETNADGHWYAGPAYNKISLTPPSWDAVRFSVKALTDKVYEGGTATFQISVSGDVSASKTLYFYAEPSSLDNPDIVPVLGRAVVFTPGGPKEQTISVAVHRDADRPSGDESFTYALRESPTNDSAALASGVVTIESDPAPSVSVFLQGNATAAVDSTDLRIFGAAGQESLLVVSHTAENLRLDQALERVYLPADSAKYAFKRAGNLLEVYTNVVNAGPGFNALPDDKQLVLRTPLQADANGTEFFFNNGTVSASALIGADGVMTLGGMRVDSWVTLNDRFDTSGGNDASTRATPLGTLSAANPNITQAFLNINTNGSAQGEYDEDWFSFTLASTGGVNDRITLATNAAWGDIDLELYRPAVAPSPNPTRILVSDTADDFESIALTGLAPGPYLVRVVGYDEAVGGSDTYADQSPNYRLTLQAGLPVALPSTVPAVSSGAMVFLADSTSFTAAGNGMNVFGTGGRETLIVPSGRVGVVADQNVDNIQLPEMLSSYSFMQTGNQLNLYPRSVSAASDAARILNVTVQTDTDGTQFLFAGVSQTVRLLPGGKMMLADRVIASDRPTAIDLTKVVKVGGTGQYTAGFEDVRFEFTSGSYDYLISGFGTGDTLVLPASGVTPTLFNESYSDGKVVLEWSNLSRSIAIELGDIGAQNDARLNQMSDLNLVFGSGTVMLAASTVQATPNSVAVSGAGTRVESANTNTTFQVAAITSSYRYTIEGFGAGDRIVMPSGATASLANTNFTDGTAELRLASAANTVTIALTGLSSVQDQSLQSVSSLNSLFGAGTF